MNSSVLFSLTVQKWAQAELHPEALFCSVSMQTQHHCLVLQPIIKKEIKSEKNKENNQRDWMRFAVSKIILHTETPLQKGIVSGTQCGKPAEGRRTERQFLESCIIENNWIWLFFSKEIANSVSLRAIYCHFSYTLKPYSQKSL